MNLYRRYFVKGFFLILSSAWLCSCGHTGPANNIIKSKAKTSATNTLADTAICGANIYISDKGSIIVFKGDSCYLAFDGEFHYFKWKNNTSAIIISAYNADTDKASLRKLPDNSVDLTINNENSRHFTKLCPAPAAQTVFSSIKYKTNGCGINQCPEFSLEIDSNGSFLFTGYKQMKTPTMYRGKLAAPLVDWLRSFLDSCKWESYATAYSDPGEASDQREDSLFVHFPDAPPYKMFDYANNAPKELVSVTSYMVELAWLININYFKRGAASGEHYFTSDLKKCRTLEDSIRYMSDFDTANYKLPTYPGGLDSIDKGISVNYDDMSHNYTLNEGHAMADISINYSINTNGSITLVNAFEYPDSTKAVSELIKYNLDRAFMTLSAATPGIYHGKQVAVKRKTEVLF